MTESVERRTFLNRAILTAIALRPGLILDLAPTPTLRIGVLTRGDRPSGRDDRHNGALLGVEEATHAAALFGGRVVLVPVPFDATDAAAVAELSAIVGDDDRSHCIAMGRLAEKSGGLVMNVDCASDELRGAECRANTFHVAPSDAMCRDAVAQSKTEGPVVAWDARLERFGADSLNQRFNKRFGTDMTSSAWAAWMAVKALWEASLRTKSVDGRRLAAHLASDATQFDGHKGRGLSFRPWDRQLRQPLYVKSASGIIEVPAIGPEGETSRNVLDRLGTTGPSSQCRLGP